MANAAVPVLIAKFPAKFPLFRPLLDNRDYAIIYSDECFDEERKHMILDWIYQKIAKRLEKKKQDVIRLRWQKAQLQRQLEDLKRKQKISNYE